MFAIVREQSNLILCVSDKATQVRFIDKACKYPISYNLSYITKYFPIKSGKKL